LGKFSSVLDDYEQEVAANGRVCPPEDRVCLTYCRQRKGKSSGGTLFLSDMGLVATVDAAI
jgi:hypothetical protein